MAVDFSAFKEKLSKAEVEKLEKEHKQEQQSRTYAEVPSGTYAVRLSGMELKETTWGTQQINISFEILDGEFKGQRLFYNGSLDDHFAHGFGATARLISEMTDHEVDENSILYNITKDSSVVEEYLVDLYQTLAGAFEYDLDYTIKESKKVNPNTNAPYVNKFYRIKDVYDI